MLILELTVNGNNKEELLTQLEAAVNDVRIEVPVTPDPEQNYFGGHNEKPGEGYEYRVYTEEQVNNEQRD